MAQQTGVALLGTIDGKIAPTPVEVPGIGKGFRRDYIFPQSEQDKGISHYQHDIGQIANALAEAVTDTLKFKHTPVADTSNKTPMFGIVEDNLGRTRYVIFGGPINAKAEPRRGTVVLVQDDTCNYDSSLLKNFVDTL